MRCCAFVCRYVVVIADVPLAGGVLWDGVFVLLSELVGIHCPQGSELSGEYSVFCFCVHCVLTCHGNVGTIGWNVEVGLCTKAEVEGKWFVCKGYIPSCQSCLLIRSASLVILLMSSYAVRPSMAGKSSNVLQ